MKVFRLCTLCNTTGFGFDEPVALRHEETLARLVLERTFPVMDNVRQAGRTAEGMVRLEGFFGERVFKGQPWLLEIVTTAEADDSALPTSVRSELDTKTAETLALLEWTFSGSVGSRIGQAMFVRSADDPPDIWEAEVLSTVRVGHFVESHQQLSDAWHRVEDTIGAQPELRRNLITTGIRWWHSGLDMEAPADKLVAHWIALESAAFAISSGQSVRARIGGALSVVYPGLIDGDDLRRVHRLRDRLYDARCAVVHSGKRDLPDLNVLVLLAEQASASCISYLVTGERAGSPTESLLSTLGV